MNPTPEPMPARSGDPILALVAGGKSTRMGHDKALLRIDGETVFGRTIRLARDAGFPQIWVVGRETPIEPSSGIRFFPDDFPDRGPLEGIATALRRLNPDDVLNVLPCDLPSLTLPALLWMRSITSEREHKSPGWTLLQDGRRQPLISAWAAHGLPRVESLLTTGKGSVAHGADVLGLAGVAIPDVHQWCFRGANTPAEWHQLTGKPLDFSQD